MEKGEQSGSKVLRHSTPVVKQTLSLNEMSKIHTLRDHWDVIPTLESRGGGKGGRVSEIDQYIKHAPFLGVSQLRLSLIEGWFL